MATLVLDIVGEFAKFFADSRCKGRAFEPEIPEVVASIADCNVLEMPAAALTTTLRRSSFARLMMISAEAKMRRAFAIDVPPNLRVIIKNHLAKYCNFPEYPGEHHFRGNNQRSTIIFTIIILKLFNINKK